MLKVSELSSTCPLGFSSSVSGNSVQQIGLSLPVIIIKQEESCQCQCACRDAAKEKSSKSASSIVSAPAPQQAPEPPPPPLPQPPEPPRLPSPSSCLPKSSSTAGEVSLEAAPSSPSSSSAQTFSTSNPPSAEGLSTMDVSDFLSLQSPGTTANIEALLLVTDEFNMATDGNP